MLLFLFLLGLIVGSFLNVLVLRGEKEESLGGRSHCTKCHALIHWYDNIPLFSFFILGGKCRSCRALISWQYPLVELSTGLVFLVIGYFFQDAILEVVTQYRFFGDWSHWVMLAIFSVYLVLASLLVAIFVTDLRTMTIPLPWLIAGLLLSLGVVGLGAFLPSISPISFLRADWMNQLAGGMIASIVFAALVFFSHETWMGKGDIWLAAVVGLTVGAEALLFALTLSFLLGSVVGVGLILTAAKGWKSQIAFGPFLITALFLTWVVQWASPLWFQLFLFPTELFYK